MASIKGYRQRGPQIDAIAGILVLPEIGAVPGKDDIQFVLLEKLRKPVGVIPHTGKENIGIREMKDSEPCGKIASLVAFLISDPDHAREPRGSFLRPDDSLVHSSEDCSRFVIKHLSGIG